MTRTARWEACKQHCDSDQRRPLLRVLQGDGHQFISLSVLQGKKAAFHFSTYWPRISLKCGSSSMWYFLRYPYSSSVPRTFAMRTSWNRRHVEREQKGQATTFSQRQSCPNLRALLLETSQMEGVSPSKLCFAACAENKSPTQGSEA